MKQVAPPSISQPTDRPSARSNADLLLATIPLIMMAMRREARARGRDFALTIPQFRTLAFLNLNDRPTLTDLAEHIGLQRPTMSKMVEGLVQRGLIAREPDPNDRRCIRLELTVEGTHHLGIIRNAMCDDLATLLGGLGTSEYGAIQSALSILHSVFAGKGADA